jgi:hypothetical protein
MLYNVSEGYGTDLKYLRNKLLELGQMAELTRRILEGTAEKTLVAMWYEWGSVKLRIRVVNNLEDVKSEMPVKAYLPKEIRNPESEVLDKGGLEVGYDADKDVFYVFTPITPENKCPILLPKGSAGSWAEFTIVLKDVWVIPEEDLVKPINEAKDCLTRLEGTPLLGKGQELFGKIDTDLALIQEKQRKSMALTPEEHISIYRDNVEILKNVKIYLEMLKKLVTPEGAAEALGLTVTGTAAAGVGKGEGEGKGGGEGAPPSLGLTASMAWKLMLIIITFLGLLSIIFFLIWQQQLRKSRVIPELKLPELEETGSERSESKPPETGAPPGGPKTT